MRKHWFLVLMLAAVSTAWAQRDFSKVEEKVEKVSGTVYMLTGAGGNIALSVGEDGVVMVDDQFAPLAPKIHEAIKSVTDKPLRFVINTHWHHDHTGGNPEFSPQATIIAQSNVRKRLIEGLDRGPGANAPSTPPASKEALPVITFDESLTIHLNGEDIRAIHFPRGHTDGDSVIFFPQSNVVHMGDDFVTYGFPFVDVASGGSVSGMIAGCEKVLATVPADAKFIPGHGPLSNGDDVRKFVTMMKETRQAVADALKKGMTLQQIKDQKVLEKWDALGHDFIKTDAWIDVLYDDITHSKTGHEHYMNHGHADEKPAGS